MFSCLLREQGAGGSTPLAPTIYRKADSNEAAFVFSLSAVPIRSSGRRSVAVSPVSRDIPFQL